MRLLYAPGLSDSVAKMEALRACMNGTRNDTNGVGPAGTARQYAASAGNRGGMVVLTSSGCPKFHQHSSRKIRGGAAFTPEC
jgi:hypothetical protein